MQKINKYNKTTFTSISSDEISYQGIGISCLSEDCSNSTITGVIDSIGKISCYSYDELNSLSNVDLGTLSGQVACDDKTLLKLFNLTFERLGSLQNSITGLETSTPGKIILDFCTAVNYSCSDTCLFEVPCCSADEGQFINDILQTIIGRTIRHSNQICTINETLIDIQDQINELEAGTGGTYTPPKVTLSCTSYWNGSAYIPTPLVEFSLEGAIVFLDEDLCQVKKTVGRYDDFITNRNKQYIDPITNTIVYDYTTALNQVDFEGLLADYLFYIKLQVNAIQSKLDECCRTDCDKCMDNYFTNVSTNYGQVANGSASTPYIDLYHVINTQALPTCIGNAVVLSKSSYYISDGVTTKVVALDELEGITVQSGTIDTQAFLRFDLAELNMDYLKDIIIRLKVVTALDCVDNYRELIQRFDNPVCDQCMFCIKRLLDTDTSNYNVSFDLNFSGGVYANETRSYTLSTSNPCISIDKKVGQVVTLSNVINLNPSKAMLYSDCAEFGLPEPCDTPEEVLTDTTCWFFELPLVEMFDARAHNITLDTQSPPGVPVPPLQIDVRTDFGLDIDPTKFGYVYKTLISTANLTGEVIGGEVFELVTTAGPFHTADNNIVYINPLVPTSTAGSKIKDKEVCGSTIVTWDAIDGFNDGVIEAEDLLQNANYDFPDVKKLSANYSKDGRFGIMLEITGQTTETPPLIELRSRATDSAVYLRGEQSGNCNC